jgi:hypothetical protein
VYIQMADHPNAKKNGYVSEHVAIASASIGRAIAPNEVVHHLNGVRDDNRPENLEVMTRSAHHSLHHKGVHKPGSYAALRLGKTSDEMREIWATKRAHERAAPKVCAHCGEQFFRKGTRPKFCSHPCYAAHNRKH